MIQCLSTILFQLNLSDGNIDYLIPINHKCFRKVRWCMIYRHLQVAIFSNSLPLLSYLIAILHIGQSKYSVKPTNRAREL